MKAHFYAFFILCATTFLLNSCQESAKENTETAEATLVWSGEYMVDGCGFEVVVNDKKFKPENEDDIDASLKVEGATPVMIEFVRLGKQIDRPCGLSPASKAMDGIRVISVKRK